MNEIIKKLKINKDFDLSKLKFNYDFKYDDITGKYTYNIYGSDGVQSIIVNSWNRQIFIKTTDKNTLYIDNLLLTKLYEIINANMVVEADE